MSVLRHYITGTDGTISGIGGCPFNMDALQRDYVEGSITPTKIINFGKSGPGALTTDVNMAVEKEVDGVDGKQVLDVLAVSGFFETSTLNFRIPNLHKPGSARASDVWVVIPDNIVVPQLIRKLHQGAVDEINIATLYYVNNADTEAPKIVQNYKFKTCFIKCVDPNSYGFLTVFSFSYVWVSITQIDISQTSTGGKNIKTGKYVYAFDYSKSEGKGS